MFAKNTKSGAGVFGLLLAAAVSLPALAGEGAEAPDAVLEGLQKIFPGTPVDSVKPAGMPGLYQATVGARLFYVSEDGKYLMQGELYDIDARVNLTELAETEIRLAAMQEITEDEMIIFEPKEAKHTITVFTDIDCGYCRKLHGEMEAYNDKGIRVRYLFYPRSGPNSPSFDKAVSVWCADDRNQAMTDAKTGKPVEPRTCDNPVADHYALGGTMGVRGTPAIILEDGEMLPGYVPADRLSKALEAPGMQAK